MESAQSAQLNRLFREYAEYHVTRGNVVCHYFGIPLIIVGLVGLLGAWGPVPLVLAFIWYFTMDVKLAIAFGVVGAALFFIGFHLGSFVLWTFFIGGWILQFYGHYHFEKKSPAFLRNVVQLLIGPIWILAKLLKWKDV